jgi:hypothetical protein
MKDPDNYQAGIYVSPPGSAGDAIAWKSTTSSLPNRGIISSTLPSKRLVMAHTASSGTASMALVTVQQLKGEDKGWEFWQQFNAKVWRYTESGAAPTQQVGQARRRSASSSPMRLSCRWGRVCRSS